MKNIKLFFLLNLMVCFLSSHLNAAVYWLYSENSAAIKATNIVASIEKTAEDLELKVTTLKEALEANKAALLTQLKEVEKYKIALKMELIYRKELLKRLKNIKE